MELPSSEDRLRRLAGLSGLTRNNPQRLTLIVHLLGPHPFKTPAWVKASRLTYTHAAFEVDNKLWDQPYNSRCRVHNADEWCAEKLWVVPRDYAAFEVTAYVDYPTVARAIESLEGRKGIPLLIALRWLRMWPTPVWNCVSSVRSVLGSMGLKTKAETPDGLNNYLKLCATVSPSIQRMAPRVTQIVGGPEDADPSTD